MFAIININTQAIVIDNGSKIPEEERPRLCIFEQEKHAIEYHKLSLLNLNDYQVVAIKSISW